MEAAVSKEEFDQLRFQVENHFLEKTRYEIPYNGVTIELDVYKNLQGLKTRVELRVDRILSAVSLYRDWKNNTI